MTGSGAAAGPTEIGELRVEIRTVNARGLTVKQRLAAACSGLEPALEELVRRSLRRGSVLLTVERVDTAGALGDRAGLKRLLQELRELAAELGIACDLGLRDLLACAGMARLSEATGLRELPPRVAALAQQALDEVQQRRRAEGSVTLAAMREHLAELRRLHAAAAQRAPELVQAWRDRLLERVRDFVAEQGLQLQPADVVREVALFADRVDTSEELQRLLAHLDEVDAVLAAGAEVGRRLEFLLQELLREANTLGAKSPDVTLAHVVVAMKSLIDKLKEQAANLE